jgi:hypothetical protein
MPDGSITGPFGRISRRAVISSTLLAGAAFLSPTSFEAGPNATATTQGSRKTYEMKKSINL